MWSSLIGTGRTTTTQQAEITVHSRPRYAAEIPLNVGGRPHREGGCLRLASHSPPVARTNPQTRVYDLPFANVIEAHEHKGEFKA